MANVSLSSNLPVNDGRLGDAIAGAADCDEPDRITENGTPSTPEIIPMMRQNADPVRDIPIRVSFSFEASDGQ